MGPPLSRKVGSMWTLFTAPAVWAAHFLACYVLAAVFCAKAQALGLHFDILRIALGTLTVIALMSIVVSVLQAWRQWGFGPGDTSSDAPTRQGRVRFQGYVTLLLSGLSSVAVMFTAIPVLFITSCVR